MISAAADLLESYLASNDPTPPQPSHVPVTLYHVVVLQLLVQLLVPYVVLMHLLLELLVRYVVVMHLVVQPLQCHVMGMVVAVFYALLFHVVEIDVAGFHVVYSHGLDRESHENAKSL